MNSHHTIGDKSLGMIIGAVMGVINSLMSLYVDIGYTIFLAVIGSTAGFLTTTFLKYLKNKYFN